MTCKKVWTDVRAHRRRVKKTKKGPITQTVKGRYGTTKKLFKHGKKVKTALAKDKRAQLSKRTVKRPGDYGHKDMPKSFKARALWDMKYRHGNKRRKVPLTTAEAKKRLNAQEAKRDYGRKLNIKW